MNGTPTPLQARVEGGGTPEMGAEMGAEMDDWYLRSETGTLRDVLLGPAESFRWLGLENAAWSSLVRDTLRRGLRFDKQLAMRQHREMVDAYEQAGVTCHYLPIDENVPYQVYARDSSLHVALRRRHLPAREPEEARRIRDRAALLPGERHPRLRHGLGGQLRRRRLQHHPPRGGDRRLHRPPFRAGRGGAGGELVRQGGMGGQVCAHRRLLRPHRPHGLHAERAMRRGVPGHHAGGRRRVAGGSGHRDRARHLQGDDGARVQRGGAGPGPRALDPGRPGPQPRRCAPRASPSTTRT